MDFRRCHPNPDACCRDKNLGRAHELTCNHRIENYFWKILGKWHRSRVFHILFIRLWSNLCLRLPLSFIVLWKYKGARFMELQSCQDHLGSKLFQYAEASPVESGTLCADLHIFVEHLHVFAAFFLNNAIHPSA